MSVVNWTLYRDVGMVGVRVGFFILIAFGKIRWNNEPISEMYVILKQYQAFGGLNKST